MLLLMFSPTLLIIIVLLKGPLLHRFLDFKVEGHEAISAIPEVTIAT